MKSDKLASISSPRKPPRSPSQAQASRQNGAKSHGPITETGKYHSSRGALRHGLSASTHTLLANEDPAQYKEVLDSLVADYQPATKAELRLVEQMANLNWRMERFAMMENCLLNMTVADHAAGIEAAFKSIDGIGVIVEAWRQSQSLGDCLNLLQRYMGSLQHQYNSAIANFEKMEKRRRARRHDPDVDPDFNPPYQPPEFETLNKEPDGSPMLPLPNEPDISPSLRLPKHE